MSLFHLIFSNSHQGENFSSMTEKELMEQFKTDTWDSFSKEEKIALLQETGDRYAEQVGITDNPKIMMEACQRRHFAGRRILGTSDNSSP